MLEYESRSRQQEGASLVIYHTKLDKRCKVNQRYNLLVSSIIIKKNIIDEDLYKKYITQYEKFIQKMMTTCETPCCGKPLKP